MASPDEDPTIPAAAPEPPQSKKKHLIAIQKLLRKQFDTKSITDLVIAKQDQCKGLDVLAAGINELAEKGWDKKSLVDFVSAQFDDSDNFFLLGECVKGVPRDNLPSLIDAQKALVAAEQGYPLPQMSTRDAPTLKRPRVNSTAGIPSSDLPHDDVSQPLVCGEGCTKYKSKKAMGDHVNDKHWTRLLRGNTHYLCCGTWYNDGVEFGKHVFTTKEKGLLHNIPKTASTTPAPQIRPPVPGSSSAGPSKLQPLMQAHTAHLQNARLSSPPVPTTYYNPSHGSPPVTAHWAPPAGSDEGLDHTQQYDLSQSNSPAPFNDPRGRRQHQAPAGYPQPHHDYQAASANNVTYPGSSTSYPVPYPLAEAHQTYTNESGPTHTFQAPIDQNWQPPHAAQTAGQAPYYPQQGAMAAYNGPPFSHT